MRYCGEGRFSSRIITRSFSYKVPIDRCYNCCKYSLLQCCSRNAKIFVELIDIDRDLHFDFSQIVLWYWRSMHCQSGNDLESKDSDRTKGWKVGNSDRILFALAECIALRISLFRNKYNATTFYSPIDRCLIHEAHFVYKIIISLSENIVLHNPLQSMNIRKQFKNSGEVCG